MTNRTYLLALALIAATLFIALPTKSSAQTFTTLINFRITNGAYPNTSMIQGIDGNLYGTTSGGGSRSCGGCGVIFRMTSSGILSIVSEFDANPDGEYPSALMQTANGDFYGTTVYGGANNDGTVFEISPSGSFTLLHTFDYTDDGTPTAGLVQGPDGNLYGGTYSGGANYDGTIFAITPQGTLTTLHNFNGTDGDGSEGALVLATNGNFYGTTHEGGTSTACTRGCGTVFTVTPEGTLTSLHSFDGSDGSSPMAGLVQGNDGNFYGTTSLGGLYNGGTVFKMSPAGSLTTIHNFCSNPPTCTDGANPDSALVLGTDGSFYGTTVSGGAFSSICRGPCGTVFKITSSGTLTILHSFQLTDGDAPYGGLVQATNGTFYGTTQEGGTHGQGTIFSISTGLGPFVETNPAFGRVGTSAIILGNNLTGTTAVTFNGTAAAFTVISSSAIKATVPDGATTGTVEVTTLTGVLNSNTKFRVLP
jgi:uncharacterized repeat protein (TIGR03803 family)